MADSELSHHSSRRSLRERLVNRERSPALATVPPAPNSGPPAELPSPQEQPEHAGPSAVAGDELVRHPDLWFCDGSIVLRAENMLFRVHISQLSRHSALFADMLALPQPTPSSFAGSSADEPQWNRIDGCPVLRLHDKAADVAHLLHALYDGPCFGDNGRDDFRAVSGVLRLANKYDIEKLHRLALEHLRIAWPATLRGWDAREDLARMFEIESGLQQGCRYPSPVAVIGLAREVDAPELLPAAFYDLSRYPYAHIFDGGGEGGDGSDALGGGALAPRDMQRLALGKEAAAHAVPWLIQSMAHGSHRESRFLTAEGGGGAPPFSYAFEPAHARRRAPGLACTSASACRKDFAELVELATQHYLFDRERGCADPLYVAEELGQLKSAEFSECKACARSLEAWAARERERMWKLIPAWFRIEA